MRAVALRMQGSDKQGILTLANIFCDGNASDTKLNIKVNIAWHLGTVYMMQEFTVQYICPCYIITVYRTIVSNTCMHNNFDFLHYSERSENEENITLIPISEISNDAIETQVFYKLGICNNALMYYPFQT